MFWRKKKIPTPPVKAKIQVIPDEFYGTKDPVVHYASEKKMGVKNNLIKKENLGEASYGVKKVSLADLFRNKKTRIIIFVIFLLISVGLISWYYIAAARKTTLVPEAANNESILSEPIAEDVPIAEEPVITPTSTEVVAPSEEIISTTTEKIEEFVLEFPSIFLVNSVDTDSDLLSDLEELSIGTDANVWDTDGDGYYDGQEFFNLYNPKGLAPMRLIDSGIAREYVNPVWQYRIYYPAQWAASAIDPNANQVLFSALSGDYIEIFSDKMLAGETFTDWFARKAKGQQFSDLQSLSNRFKEKGWKRKDDLTAYFFYNDNVFALVYHPGTTGDIPYRHVMQMMVQSFRPAKTGVILAEQVVLPTVDVVEQNITISSTVTSTQ